MVHVLEDGDLIVDRQDGVVVPAQELLLQNFYCGEVPIGQRPGQVHLGRVTFAERLDDLVLLVKNWVLGPLALRVCHSSWMVS